MFVWSYDIKGLSTLWGSFEIKNEILLTNMMLQFSKKDLLTHKSSFQYYADQFEKLPLYFMSFYGSQDVDKIMSCIEYAIYQYDIQHIIIDNLQFLLGTQARGFDKFDLQDKVIEKFRNLVSSRNVHLSLVIHPKKVNDNEDLNISSVFGSAKATQEADNVLIMQNRDKYRVLEVKKNRFDGTTGRTALIFDRKTKTFVQINKNQVVQMLKNEVTATELLKEQMDQQKGTESDQQTDAQDKDKEV